MILAHNYSLFAPFVMKFTYRLPWVKDVTYIFLGPKVKVAMHCLLKRVYVA